MTDGVPALPDDSVVEPRALDKAGTEPALAGNNSVRRKDQLALDDPIVDGSGCFGFDCVNGESFGFDTLRLKENFYHRGERAVE